MARSKNKQSIRNKRRGGSRGGRRGGQGSNAPSPFTIAAMIGVPTVVLIAGGALAWQQLSLEKLDAAFCLDRDDQAKHAIFLDQSLTTDLSAQQYRDYQQVFENTYEQAQANTNIMVFTTANDVEGSIAKPVFQICKPAGSVSENERLGAPSQNAAYLSIEAGEARSEFDTHVAQTLRDAQDPSKAAADSPILEQLQAISRYRDFDGLNRSLSVITDGVQNTAGTASFCLREGHMPPFAVFKTESLYRYVKPESLEGVNVNLFLVESVKFPHSHAPYCTNNEIRQFWPAYFTDNGAANVTLTRLRHGAAR